VHWMREKLPRRIERASARAGTVLPDAPVVLDQDVALGGEGKRAPTAVPPGTPSTDVGDVVRQADDAGRVAEATCGAGLSRVIGGLPSFKLYSRRTRCCYKSVEDGARDLAFEPAAGPLRCRPRDVVTSLSGSKPSRRCESG